MKHGSFRAALLLLALLILMGSLAACRTSSDYKRLDEGTSDFVALDVRGFGTIIIELYPLAAPETVDNFKGLVAADFYKNSSFHRIVESFVIQGGKSANGTYAEPIFGEFALNGYQNPLKHERGVISMARTAYDYNSASSQFFIVLETNQNNTRSLDGQYAAFGRVVEGMRVVDKIAALECTSADAPLTSVTISEAYFVTRK